MNVFFLAADLGKRVAVLDFVDPSYQGMSFSLGHRFLFF